MSRPIHTGCYISINTILHREMLEMILGYVHPQIVRLVCKMWNGLTLPNWNKSLATYLARNGYLDILIWAENQGIPFNANMRPAAARGGHTDVFRWLLLDPMRLASTIPIKGKCCEKAVKGGHLETLKYLRSRGYEWVSAEHMIKRYKREMSMFGRSTCLIDNSRTRIRATLDIATVNGHLDIIEWITEDVKGSIHLLDSKLAKHQHVADWITAAKRKATMKPPVIA